mmetsp:Transcript_365/g.882  ORF Transcript_365/g.882 Transcript_365/m.882 type:complete len:381 (+) Transcript_365:28-1170(+)|eukprot:CAMPEP_0116845886 /NCGR_PEP_ID=MMETSP0418-20121206/13529_1 /TAXON_ID=1158023 /ORGANISM="Astrosyne radiata, Strain 13vi08-1A" /LENGTH=380 /DNA_ID=CAMNT_0004477073 /DNA_START=22 /DNA_END=1164 /DNA_ORIENTATION=-
MMQQSLPTIPIGTFHKDPLLESKQHLEYKFEIMDVPDEQDDYLLWSSAASTPITSPSATMSTRIPSPTSEVDMESLSLASSSPAPICAEQLVTSIRQQQEQSACAVPCSMLPDIVRHWALTEEFLACRERFQFEGKMSRVSVACHYVQHQDLRTQGWLQTSPGGIWTTTSSTITLPTSSWIVLVAIVRGNAKCVDANRDKDEFRFLETHMDSWVVSEQTVLRRCCQALPLVAIRPESIDSCRCLQQGFQRLMDQVLNGESFDATPMTPPLTPTTSIDEGEPRYNMTVREGVNHMISVEFTRDARFFPSATATLLLSDTPQSRQLLARLEYAWQWGLLPLEEAMRVEGASPVCIQRTLDGLGVPSALECVYKTPRRNQTLM